MFITFEGVEGSGKSTQSKMLHDFLLQKGEKVVLTREPGGVEAAEKIRSILLEKNLAKLNTKSEILLNFSARIEHVEKLIAPSLNAGKTVICDRFIDSTFAYQGYGFGADLKFIEQIQNLAIDNFKPDITFLIDLPVEIAFDRIKNRATNNRYEELDIAFHERTRYGFLELAKKNSRIIIIDGSKSIDLIFQEILQYYLNA